MLNYQQQSKKPFRSYLKVIRSLLDVSKKNVVSSYQIDSQTSNKKVDGSFTSYFKYKKKTYKVFEDKDEMER